MAKCRFCSKGGWTIRIDHLGVCRTCRESIEADVAARMEYVRQALAYVRTAHDPDVQVSFCEVAIETVEKLLPYEERRLAVFNPLPSTLMLILEAKRDEALEQASFPRLQPRSLKGTPVALLDLSAPAADGPEMAGAERSDGARWWAWGDTSCDPAGEDCPEREQYQGDRRFDGRIGVGCNVLVLPHGKHATLCNLSTGGMFLRTDLLQPENSGVRMIVSTSRGPVRAEGIVRWTTDHRQARQAREGAGMGIEFTRISVELLEYLEQRLGCRVSLVPSPGSEVLASSG